jgi:L-asparaginase
MIHFINTGGTFNKRYNPISGNLDVPSGYEAIEDILKKSLFNQKYKITQIISKDSLEFTKKDRELLLQTIQKSKSDKIVVIHGTDTMKKSAKFISSIKNKKIVFCGAMKPYEINSVEATSNLFLAIGFIQNAKNGVYIAMNGIVDSYKRIEKDYKKGVFYLNES